MIFCGKRTVEFMTSYRYGPNGNCFNSIDGFYWSDDKFKITLTVSNFLGFIPDH